MPGSRPCCCRTQWIQLGALARSLMEPGWDSPAWGWAGACAWGKGPGESGPHPTAAKAELTARVCLDQTGLRKWSLATTCPHLAVPLGQGRTCHFSTGDQLTQGGYSFAHFGAWGIPAATTLGEWTPASQSQQEEGPRGKREADRAGDTQAAPWRAGRQAGRLGKESLELGKRRGLLQGLLQG